MSEGTYFIDLLDEAVSVDLCPEDAAFIAESFLSSPGPSGAELEIVEHGTLRVVAAWRALPSGDWHRFGVVRKNSPAWKALDGSLQINRLVTPSSQNHLS